MTATLNALGSRTKRRIASESPRTRETNRPDAARRRFPPPWSVEEGETYFVVKDSNGQKLGYFYFEDEPSR